MATPPRYEFRIEGRLDPRWDIWFEGLTLVPHDDTTTMLSAGGMDQAAVHGVLAQLRDLGVTVISMRALDGEDRPT